MRGIVFHLFNQQCIPSKGWLFKIGRLGTKQTNLRRPPKTRHTFPLFLGLLPSNVSPLKDKRNSYQ